MSFKLVDPYLIEGFINDDAKEIYLFTTDDLNGFSAEAVASAHASVKEDLTVKKNYNEEQVVTMVAHDGTEHEYKIIKKYPTKIPYGFREASVRQLFNFDAASRLGFPTFSAELIKRDISIFQDVMKKRNTAGILVIHLFCQMEGMENIGKTAFVHLPVMGLIGDLHSTIRQWCINHIIKLHNILVTVLLYH